MKEKPYDYSEVNNRLPLEFQNGKQIFVDQFLAMWTGTAPPWEQFEKAKKNDLDGIWLPVRHPQTKTQHFWFWLFWIHMKRCCKSPNRARWSPQRMNMFSANTKYLMQNV
jgi:hypothetical protein